MKRVYQTTCLPVPVSRMKMVSKYSFTGIQNEKGVKVPLNWHPERIGVSKYLFTGIQDEKGLPKNLFTGIQIEKGVKVPVYLYRYLLMKRACQST